MFAAIRQVRLRHLLVAAVLALPFLVFFAPTLVAGNAPGAFDLSFQSSPWRDQPSRPLDAQSPVQIDQAEQLPWVDGMWESLGEGRVPMWTPAVGGGTSLGTNPVFATYSVFTIVGQIVGGALGLAIRVLLAVAVAELFTYLVVRRMGLSVGASVLATVAYVFSGSTIAFETRNAIPLLFPVALWCTDRLVERVTPGRVVALAGAVLALWLEGFPAMLVHVVVVCGLWWLVRSATTIGLDVRIAEVRRAWLRAVGAFGGAMALGGLLSAFSAVPFALQLKYNDVFGARASEGTPLGRVSAWWMLDERALGVPDRGPWFMALNPFEGEAAVGTIVMVLAVAGVVLGATRRRAGSDLVRTTWAVTVAVLVTAIYNGGVVLDVLYALPGFSGNPFSRIRFVVAFGLAVLAAMGLDEIERRIDERSGSAAEPDPVGWPERLRARWPHLVVAVLFVGFLALPFVASVDEYVDLADEFADVARRSWTSELAMLGGAVVGAALVWWVCRRLGERWQPVREIAVGAVLAALVFTQVGLQLTRFTPQVDRAFYYPETAGYDALRDATADGVRFIGSGMGTFAPNTAMTNDVVDARSHSFRDPEWKRLILSVFPDALGPDPLKINVDFHGNVNWASPVFDDLALGVIAMSSSEVPLGERSEVAAPDGWQQARGPAAVTAAGPRGRYVGLDLHVRTSGNCAQGDVAVRATVPGGGIEVSRRPLNDARAAGAAGLTLPFAIPMDDVPASWTAAVSVGLEGAPADCVLEVGTTEDGASLVAGPITRPADATWELESALGGWLYSRPSSAPLVRTIDEWLGYDDSEDALAAAASPFREPDQVMPVGNAGPPPSRPSEAVVRSWSTDDRGISASVTSEGPTLLVTAFNSAPGWTVTVDGKAAELAEPDGAFLGVELPAGDHRVRFEYLPPGLVAGSLVSLVGVIVCVALVAGPAAVRRVRRRGGPGAGSTGTPAVAAPD